MKYPQLTSYLAGTLVHFETMGTVPALVEVSKWVDEYSSKVSSYNKLYFANRELEEIFKSVEGSFEAGREVNSVIDVPTQTAEVYRLYYPEPSSN